MGSTEASGVDSPGGFGAGLGVGEAGDAGALVGREDGELDAFLRHEVEHVAVDGGFGQPHAFRLAAEAVLEVGDAPADLGEGVAGAGQRHDDVVVDLRDGGAVAGEAQRRRRGRRRGSSGRCGALCSCSQLSSVGPKLKLMRA